MRIKQTSSPSVWCQDDDFLWFLVSCYPVLQNSSVLLRQQGHLQQKTGIEVKARKQPQRMSWIVYARPYSQWNLLTPDLEKRMTILFQRTRALWQLPLWQQEDSDIWAVKEGAITSLSVQNPVETTEASLPFHSNFILRAACLQSEKKAKVNAMPSVALPLKMCAISCEWRLHSGWWTGWVS